MINFQIFIINDVYLPPSMLTDISKAQTIWDFLQFRTLPLLVPYFIASASLTCPLHGCFCNLLVTTMVNTQSGTHAFGPKMVRLKRKISRQRDVSPVIPPTRVNIHGVRMQGSSSTSAKCPRTSSSRQSRQESSDHPQAPTNSFESLEALEVNPLAMVLWVDRRVPTPPHVPIYSDISATDSDVATHMLCPRVWFFFSDVLCDNVNDRLFRDCKVVDTVGVSVSSFVTLVPNVSDVSHSDMPCDAFNPLERFDELHDSITANVVSPAAAASPFTVEILANVATGGWWHSLRL